MTCTPCESFKTRQQRGTYNLNCLDCCARLVASTRPDKTKAAAMLHAIARNKLAPKRADILARMQGGGQ